VEASLRVVARGARPTRRTGEGPWITRFDLSVMSHPTVYELPEHALKLVDLAILVPVQ